ncbi:MAG: stage V sporulation protein B [Clostridiales bacterium]|jgi:stage V sporulation protein B|nr:stage V sporulation protein B [Eubacteriales bacterium]MDH7567805.1 stage V sporulation protein B [Clostridiales bacterium]
MAKKSFVNGAIILMLSGFVVRILGFVYRIYLSNLIGAEGMGLFQLITPVYSLVILTLTSGVSIAVSKMVAAESAKNHPVNLRRITGCAAAVVISSGIAVSVFIFLNLEFISKFILKDARTYVSLLLLIPCIPVIAAASALKGYFYGIQDVSPTAVSQIVEQMVRIGLVMAMAAHFVKLGLEYASALATLGMALGEIANLAVLYIVYKAKRKRDTADKSRTGFMRKRHIFKEIIGISVPVSFNRCITSIMSAVELILIPRRLLAGGLDYQSSIEEYGRLTGMVTPLIYFPSLVTLSLATTLVPAISEAVSLKRFKAVNYRISKSIQVTFIIGFICTALFINFPNEIGNILYRRENIGPMLYLLAFTCIFTYLQQTLLGIMNGLGKQGVSLRNSVIGYAIRIGFVYYCIPSYGIRGYVWGLILSSGCVCILNLYTVIKTTGMILDFRNWIVKPGLVGIAMLLSGRYLYGFLNVFNLGNSWTLVLALILYAAVSLAFMEGIGALEKNEIKRLIGIKRSRN